MSFGDADAKIPEHNVELIDSRATQELFMAQLATQYLHKVLRDLAKGEVDVGDIYAALRAIAWPQAGLSCDLIDSTQCDCVAQTAKGLLP